MDRKLEYLLENATAFGMKRNEFILECGSSSGFTITHTRSGQIYLVINFGMMVKVYYSNKVDQHGGASITEIESYRKSFTEWLRNISEEKKILNYRIDRA